LHFPGAPADPQKLGSFIPGEPTGAGRPLRRKNNVDDSAVQTFFRMMIDGGSKIFEITSGPANGAPPSHELSAGFAGHLCELARTPKFVKTFKTCIESWATRQPLSARFVVGKKNVRDRYLFEFSLPAARKVLFGDVGAKLDLRFFNVTLNASCGDMAIAVEDDPGYTSNDFVRLVSLPGRSHNRGPLLRRGIVVSSRRLHRA